MKVHVSFNEKTHACLILSKAQFLALWQLVKQAQDSKQRDKLLNEIEWQTLGDVLKGGK